MRGGGGGGGSNQGDRYEARRMVCEGGSILVAIASDNRHTAPNGLRRVESNRGACTSQWTGKGRAGKEGGRGAEAGLAGWFCGPPAMFSSCREARGGGGGGGSRKVSASYGIIEREAA